MRIMHIVESYAAGTCSIVTALCNGQARDGHEVTLALSLRPESPARWRELLDERVTAVVVPMTRQPSPWRDARALWRLWRLVRQVRPQVVHLHSSKAGALGRLLSPLVPSARWFFSPHGWSFLQAGVQARVSPLYWCIEFMLARLPARIVACSPAEAQVGRRLLRRPLACVMNGIDCSRPPLPHQPGARLRIGTVGRVVLQRNPRLFARLAEQLRARDVEFVWIGAGDPADEACLSAAGVHVTGWLDGDGVRQALASLDIYLQTSVLEGLPVAVMEAMLQGLPVIVSRVMGNADLVTHGQTGLIADNEAQWLALIDGLLQSAVERQRLGQAAREHVCRHHSLENLVSEFYKVYAS